MTAHVFYLELQLLLCALLGALLPASAAACRLRLALGRPYLESKVLEEVCSSVGLIRLRAAASIDPHADGRCLGPRGVLGSNLCALGSIAGLLFGRGSSLP